MQQFPFFQGSQLFQLESEQQSSTTQRKILGLHSFQSFFNDAEAWKIKENTKPLDIPRIRKDRQFKARAYI
jgi:hypothetical protein